MGRYQIAAPGLDGEFRPLIERWNGGSWSVMPAPDPNTGDAFDSSLASVSCPDDGACVAVGSTQRPGATDPLIERWDGNRWVIQDAGVKASYLEAVTCLSASRCFAVGYYSSPGQDAEPLFDVWDGVRWTAHRQESTTFQLVPVAAACLGPADCFAVGDYLTSLGSQGGVIEHWKGGSWSFSFYRDFAFLSSVACPGPHECVAVGQGGISRSCADTGELRWNGTTWTADVMPRLPGGCSNHQSRLTGVSCLAARLCFAVGGRADAAGKHKALVERWNGARWGVIPTPRLDGRGILAVGCAGGATCFAVGNNGKLAAVAQRVGRTWSLVPSPTFPTTLSGLGSVACPGIGSCLSVGSFTRSNGIEAPLAEASDGAGLTLAPPNGVGSHPGFLNGVACTVPTPCLSVGADVEGVCCDTVPLIEAWDGKAWSTISPTQPPGPGYYDQQLNGISCPAISDCVAVGADYGMDTDLIEAWNGKTWVETHTPGPDGVLYGASCPTASACFAVGDYLDQPGAYFGWWHDRRWSVLPDPDPLNPDLRGISCMSATSCFSVGQAIKGFGTVGVVRAERWDGRRWSVVPTQNPAPWAQLEAVSCAGLSTCFAVGAGKGALIERWNGRAWRIMPLLGPSRPPAGSELDAISCHAKVCLAVGSYVNANGQFTLAMRWNGREWSVVASGNA